MAERGDRMRLGVMVRIVDHFLHRSHRQPPVLTG
jgi:hypothetical protein